MTTNNFIIDFLLLISSETLVKLSQNFIKKVA